jgi:predicted ribonuclease YlaK
MKPQQPRKPQKLRIDDLLSFEPLTAGQEIVYEAWREGDHIVLNGSAGTGKTFTAMYLGLEEVLDKGTDKNKLILVRSVVPTKDVGFLPGSLEEKIEVYTMPYRAICSELFEDSSAYDKLVENHSIEFISTSYIRGVTISDAVIIVDEMQNLTLHELDSIITRVGENCRIVFCGDYYQSDLTRKGDKDGINKFIEILTQMNKFTKVEFTWTDIVRSDFVRDYIMTKEMLEKAQIPQ